MAHLAPVGTVRNLRPTPRPYDHTREDTIPVELTVWEWSILEQAVHRAGIAAADEIIGRVADHVRWVQQQRRELDILDARHDHGRGAR